MIIFKEIYIVESKTKSTFAEQFQISFFIHLDRQMSEGEVVGIGLDLTPLYKILLNYSGYSESHPDSPIG